MALANNQPTGLILSLWEIATGSTLDFRDIARIRCANSYVRRVVEGLEVDEGTWIALDVFQRIVTNVPHQLTPIILGLLRHHTLAVRSHPSSATTQALGIPLQLAAFQHCYIPLCFHSLISRGYPLNPDSHDPSSEGASQSESQDA